MYRFLFVFSDVIPIFHSFSIFIIIIIFVRIFPFFSDVLGGRFFHTYVRGLIHVWTCFFCSNHKGTPSSYYCEE